VKLARICCALAVALAGPVLAGEPDCLREELGRDAAGKPIWSACLRPPGPGAAPAARQGVPDFLIANAGDLVACVRIAKGVRSDASLLRYTPDRAEQLRRVQKAVHGDVAKALKITGKYAQGLPLHRSIVRWGACVSGACQAEFAQCLQEHLDAGRDATPCHALQNIDETVQAANAAIAVAQNLPEMKCYRYIQAVRARFGWE
jgi:hypothetical protein